MKKCVRLFSSSSQSVQCAKLLETNRLLVVNGAIKNDAVWCTIPSNHNDTACFPLRGSSNRFVARLIERCGDFSSLRPFGYPLTDHDSSWVKLNDFGEGIQLISKNNMGSCRMNGRLYFCKEGTKLPQGLTIVNNGKNIANHRTILTNEHEMSVSQLKSKIEQFGKSDDWYWLVKFPNVENDETSIPKWQEKEARMRTTKNTNNKEIHVTKLIQAYTKVKNLFTSDDNGDDPSINPCTLLRDGINIDIDNHINKDNSSYGFKDRKSKIELFNHWLNDLLKLDKNLFDKIMTLNKDNIIMDMSNNNVNDMIVNYIIRDSLIIPWQVPQDFVLSLKQENTGDILPLIENKQWMYYSLGFRGLEKMFEELVSDHDNDGDININDDDIVNGVELSVELDTLYEKFWLSFDKLCDNDNISNVKDMNDCSGEMLTMDDCGAVNLMIFFVKFKVHFAAITVTVVIAMTR